MLEAVIFDMDGIIIDSHQIANKLLIEAANSFGCNITIADIRKYGSLSSRQFWQKIKTDFNLPNSVSELRSAYKSDDEIDYYKNLDPIEGIVEFLELMVRNKIKTGLATSASKRRMKTVVELFKIEHHFNVMLCDEDVTESKPDPEIYLNAAKKLQVPTNSCVVLEDSENGKISAKKAGMKVIGYTGLDHVHENMDGCDLIVDNFHDLKLEHVKSLFSNKKEKSREHH